MDFFSKTVVDKTALSTRASVKENGASFIYKIL